MNRYLVRVNCEYSIEVDAISDAAAIAIANEHDLAEWTQAWSTVEVEDDGPSPVDVLS